MTRDTAFIGDVHGCLDALVRLVGILTDRGVQGIVLLGDYVNKGPQSRGVVDYMLDGATAGHLTPLKGNHESVFVDAVITGDVRPLLRMAGAPTIKSYVGGHVGPDVASALKAAVPRDHVHFLASLPTVYSRADVIAAHKPVPDDSRFAVSAHTPVGDLPEISASFARIDTGCGSGSGRLTAFMWPSMEFVQVDESGRLI